MHPYNYMFAQNENWPLDCMWSMVTSLTVAEKIQMSVAQQECVRARVCIGIRGEDERADPHAWRTVTIFRSWKF